jgi:hypothetical protein
LMTRGMRHCIVLALFGWCLALVACDMGLGFFDTKGTPRRYLVPSGYVGWVTIEYDVKGAPPIARNGKYLLFKIPKSGRLKTSSPVDIGWANKNDSGWTMDEYFFYDAGGLKERIHEQYDGGADRAGIRAGSLFGSGTRLTGARFFVGKKSDHGTTPPI